MGCGSSSTGAEPPRDHRHHNNNDFTGGHKKDRYDDKPQKQDPTPPPRKPTPPPREPTPPPREPTPPPREPTLPPREPTPPPREPTPPPPPPSQQKKVSDGYELTYSGMYESSPYQFRQHPEKLDKGYSDPPRDLPFVDDDFGPHIAIEGVPVDWKRPGEFRDAPVLFSDGTTRYDIGQGSAGTCWFLSIVAMLADRPKLFHRVVPKDAWNQEGGHFHCYFWRFGEWEAVYIDDFLPIVDDTELWGAKSAEDRNEMWPALLEKAFARFHGNYDAVYGGMSGDAFLALTGGCPEYIDVGEALKADAKGSQMKKALALHRRLKNAFQQGETMITSDVPIKHFNRFGLVGEHAYSLTDAVTAKTDNGKNVHLVRVRNPWGNTEWTGPWSDGSREWSSIDSSSVPHPKKNDGEFWMSLKDFIRHFSGVTVCSIVPDFDKDGCADSLNHCTSMIGDWYGETAAGFQDIINNPRYMFRLTDEGKDDDGKVPIVVQICQRLKHRQLNKLPIRVDLCKVLGEQTAKGKPVIVMELLVGETTDYNIERQMSGRYKVEPGLYAVLPSSRDAGTEKEFIVRVYTPFPLYDVREIGRDYAVMETSEFVCPDKAVSVSHSKTFFGEFKQGVNAGGQICHSTFYKNPEIEFKITRGEQLVNITATQEKSNEIYSLGLRLFKLDDGIELKEDESHQDYLESHYNSCPRTLKGEQGTFMTDSSADITHKLRPGRYFVLLHLDSPSQQKRFAVILRSTCRLQTRLHRLD